MPSTPTGAPVVPDYTLHTGESIDAYNARVSQYYSKPDATNLTPLPNPAPVSQKDYELKDGESVDQYNSRIADIRAKAGSASAGGTATDLTNAQDQVAKQLGFESYLDAINHLKANPSQSTTDFYNEAYKAAGLDELANKIASRRSDLNTAVGNINDNPWLDEANRVGKVRNLQNLANADIKNWQDEYKTKLGNVHDTVKQHATDVAGEQKSNELMLTFLENQAKALAAEKTATTKSENTPPKTIKGPNGSILQWNPATGSFDVISGATTPTAKPVKSGSLSLTPEDISDGATRLQSSRGKDGYADTNTYLQMLSHWTTSGGLIQDFTKQYPPKNYLNPKDPLVPGFLKANP